MGMIAFKKEDLAKAKEEFLRALEIDGRFADSHRNLAKLFLREKNFKEAEKYLKQVEEIEPNSKESKLLKAYFLRETGKFAAAITIYEEIVNREPKDLDTLIELGQAALGAKDWEKAKKALADAQVVDPGNILTWYYLGIAQFRLGELDDAKTSFSRCQQLDPKNAEYYIRIGEVDFVSRRIAEALAMLQKAIELQPKNLEANELIAQIYLKNGQRKDAVAVFEKLLVLIKDRKKHSEIYYQLGEIYFVEDPRRADGYFDKSLKINPKNAQAWFRRGNIYQDFSKLGPAKSFYLKAIQANRTFCDPHYKLAFIYKEVNQIPQALASFNKFLKMCPKHPDADTAREEVDRLRGGGL
jgi:tetratricopeptide (TPR) repeat protein